MLPPWAFLAAAVGWPEDRPQWQWTHLVSSHSQRDRNPTRPKPPLLWAGLACARGLPANRYCSHRAKGVSTILAQGQEASGARAIQRGITINYTGGTSSSVTPSVPEPTSVALQAIGAAGVLGRRRRKGSCACRSEAIDRQWCGLGELGESIHRDQVALDHNLWWCIYLFRERCRLC